MMRKIVDTAQQNNHTVVAVLAENSALQADIIRLMREKNELLRRILTLQDENMELHRRLQEKNAVLSRGAKKPSSINPNSFSSAPARKSPSPQSPISPEKYARLCSRGKK